MTASGSAETAATGLDLELDGLRAVNSALHRAEHGRFTVINPAGAHAVAAGINTNIDVVVQGSVGYYAAGMHQGGTVTIDGNAGTGLAENMTSGTVRITGNTTMSAGATGVGGTLVIEGNAGARCGISMKGIDIVVGGNIGHMSAFMAQAGNLVVLGDAGEDLGDSIYEADVYVRGSVASLGSDCEAKPMEDTHRKTLAELLARAGFEAEPDAFTRYGSARKLYNFHVDDVNGDVDQQERSSAR